MSVSNRSTQIVKLHKILKKSYNPVMPNPDRPVLEQLLFGCCLENAHYEKADEAYAALIHTFFDWNEIRVTSIKELSEVLMTLPDPAAAATRVKRVLQSVFEASYSFDLEELRKKNLGPAVERLQKITGTTPFAVAYVVQSALGGHSIPIDEGAIAVFKVLELLSEKEVQQGTVPGLERAIPKNKGVEFGSLLHQLAVEFLANPHLPATHKILTQVDPEVEKRLPKRRARGETPAVATAATTESAKSQPAQPKGKGRGKKTDVSAEPAPALSEKSPSSRKKKETAEPAPSAATSKAKAKDKEAKDKGGKEKKLTTPASESKSGAVKKSGVKKSGATSASAEPASSHSKRSATAGIAKKKPR